MKIQLQIVLTFFASLFLASFSNWTNAQTNKTEILQLEEYKLFFSFTSITEMEFRSALTNIYNASFVTKINDTTKLEKAFKSIEKTYNNSEKELAVEELCKSPRCLTSFKAYYPTLNLYLFYILEMHYPKAVFVNSNTSEMASGYDRFRGDYGVMSKNGQWIGLERQGSDNYLQIEICESSKNTISKSISFDFTSVDINEKEKTPIFWVDKNTIFIAVKEYDKLNNKLLSLFYAIKFK